MTTEFGKLVEKLSDHLLHLEARVQIDDECVKQLSKLSGMIYTEAFYDPFNEKTQEFAQTLWPVIDALNAKLHFRK